LEGSELSRAIDLERIEVDGQVDPLIQLDEQDAIALSDLTATPKGATVEFSSHSYAPSWARSFDLRITVLRWPERPDVSVTIPLDRLPAKALSANWSGYNLSVSNIAWGKTTSILPPEKCLRATITYSGFTYSGYKGSEYRVVDDLGNIVPCNANAIQGSDGGSTESVEIHAIGPKAKSLRVELLNEDETAKLQTVFHFNGVAPSQR